jgi:hypothetical protein
MGKIGIAVLLCLSSSLSFGSTINSVVDRSPGTSYTATFGNSNVSFTNLVGSIITVTMSDLNSFSCTFLVVSTTGPGHVGCTVANQFSFDGSPTSSQTNSAGWLVTDLSGSLGITSVSINALPSNVAFDWLATSGSGTVKSNNAGTLSITADALMTDALHLSGVLAANATEYGTLQLNNFVGFTAGTSFGFSASNINVASAIADTPEPATAAMVSLALLGIGALRFRKPLR